MKHRTQGRELISKLKQRPMTYRAMLEASWSNSPWRRVQESLAPDEQLVKGRNFDGWVTWRVISATKWTA